MVVGGRHIPVRPTKLQNAKGRHSTLSLSTKKKERREDTKGRFGKTRKPYCNDGVTGSEIMTVKAK